MNPNLEVVQNLYRTLERGDLPGIFDLLDPEIEWVAPSSLPYGGTFHGHEGVKQS